MITERRAKSMLITAKQLWQAELETARKTGDYLDAREFQGCYDMLKIVLECNDEDTPKHYMSADSSF